jgi:hypothetical protein
MNIRRFQKKLAEIVYLFLIFFLCYTASNKLLKLDSFKTNLIKTTLFSKDMANVFSIIVISFEILLVLLLIFFKTKGLLFCGFMMLTFTLYISFLRFKGLYEVCGCGGVLNGLEYKYHFLINIGLLLGSLFAFFTFKAFENEK